MVYFGKLICLRYYFYIILLFFVSFSFLNPLKIGEANANVDKHSVLSKGNFKYIILSIDGGGVRGLIPARILHEIETRTGKPIYQLFDFIVGNSTGGIIALYLVTPGEKEAVNKAKYTASDLVELYRYRSKDIFSNSYWHKIKTGTGLWGAKYDRTNLDKILEEKLGNAVLSNTLKPTMVVSYSLDRSTPHIWTTRLAKVQPEQNDFFLKDVAGATSAAPTYFEPKMLKNISGKNCYIAQGGNPEGYICYEADGGIYANNPVVLALSESFRAIPTLRREEILLVSIGTGKPKLTQAVKYLKNSGVIGWVLNANLIDIMMNASSEISEWEAAVLDLNVIRMQIELPEGSSEMDNASGENINKLLKAAEDYISNNDQLINSLCKTLLSNYSSNK